MAQHDASPAVIIVDTLTLRSVAVESDTDVRSVQKEYHQWGSVRGRAGERIRATFIRRGITPQRRSA